MQTDSKLVTMSRCSYLRCADAVVANTKSNDCVRVLRCHQSTERCKVDAQQSQSEDQCTNHNHNNTNAEDTCSSYSNNPSDSCAATSSQVLALDRVQRRKEKKRRKRELRKTTAASSIMPTIQSLRITTSTFDSTSLLLPTVLTQSIVHVKPLIVLDLNGILCHRVRQEESNRSSNNNNNKQQSNNSIFRPSIGNMSQTDIIPRSDLHEFLSLLHENFALAVWTSATRKTAKLLVNALFPKNIRERLIFVWHRNFCNLIEKKKKKLSSSDLDSGTLSSSSISERECVEMMVKEKVDPIQSSPIRKRRRRSNKSSRIDKLCTAVDSDDDSNDEEIEAYDNMSKTTTTNNQIISSHRDLIAIKSLSKVWSEFPLWDATNTILLDDSPEKCPIQYRGNALHPPPIRGTISTAVCSNTNNGKKNEVAEAGGNKSVSSSDKLDTDSYSIIDDDEMNQKTQRTFFTLLAKHFEVPPKEDESTSAGEEDSLMKFLQEHANVHNMGWEMGSIA